MQYQHWLLPVVPKFWDKPLRIEKLSKNSERRSFVTRVELGINL